MAERIAATDAETVKKDAKLNLFTVTGIGYQGITVNIGNGERAKSPLGQDKRVRQALSLSIDRDAINQVVFNGNFTPGNQWVSPKSPWYAKGTPVPKRDIAKAQALLKEAGIANPTFTLMTPNNNETMQTSQVIQAMAKEAGFDVKIQATEFATSLQESSKGNFEAYNIGWSGRVDPDGNFYNFTACNAPLNDGKYCNKAMDELLAKSRATNDIEQRMAVYDQIAKLANDDLSVIYLYHNAWFWAAPKRLTGFNVVPDGMIRLAGMKLN